MEQKSTFSIALKPALIISVAVIAYSLVVWSLTSSLDQQKYFGWVSYLIIAGGFFFFTRSYRDDVKGGFLSYSEGLIFMILMTAIYSVIQSVYTYVYVLFIDTTMIPQLLEQAEAEMMKNPGLSEEQLEQSMKMVGYMFKPWIITVLALLGNLFYLVIGSLLLAIFTKNEKKPSFDNIQNEL